MKLLENIKTQEKNLALLIIHNGFKVVHSVHKESL